MNKVAFLNDGLRRTFGRGKVVITPGSYRCPEEQFDTVLERVRHFDEFTPENPHGEHDFGSIEIAGESYFWKIDYYHKTCEGGSEDPADPEQTTRVLTIMRADEY
jgi:hypothetical protein